MLDSRPRGCGFEPHPRHCVVSLSKNINPGLELVQPRKTVPLITERLLMGSKESNQTKISHDYGTYCICISHYLTLYFIETPFNTFANRADPD